jgi:hypothetical protein
MNLVSAKGVEDAAKAERSERREKLHAKGAMLGELQPKFNKRVHGPSKKIQSSMDELMHQLGLTPVDTLSFDVETAAPKGVSLLKGLVKGGSAKKHTTAFHVGFGVSTASSATLKSAAKGVNMKAAKKGTGGGKNKERVPGALKNFVVLEAKEVDGKIVSVSQAHSK